MRVFPDSHVPYFIFAPSWTHKSSGVRALHLLCHALNESGEKAYLFPSSESFTRNPELNTSSAADVTNDWFGCLSESGLESIAVYPDIVRGNPLEAKRVVRWLLAPAGAYGGNTDFPISDRVYGYVKDIAEPTLCLPTFDYRVFYDRHLPRSGAVYYAHKYAEIFGNKLLPLTNEAKKLEGTPQEVADMLCRAEVCYAYERTEAEVQARMCGCKVFPVATAFWNGKRPEEFESGKNLLTGAKVEVPLGVWEDRFEVQLQAFIKDTQEWKAR